MHIFILTQITDYWQIITGPLSVCTGPITVTIGLELINTVKH